MSRPGRGIIGVLACLLVVALAALSPVATPAAHADSTVTLSGHITDGQGAAVDGGRLRVRAVGGTTILYTATSDATGAYSVALPPGSYDLTYLGASASGLLAKAPNRAIPVDSTFDATVTAQAITISGVISAPYPNYFEKGYLRLYDSNSQLSEKRVDNGEQFTFSVLPGSYFFQVFERMGFDWSTNVNIVSAPALFEEDTVLDLAVPVHPFTLHVVDTTGAPVAGKVAYNCYDEVGHVPLWKSVGVDVFGQPIGATGTGTLYLASASAPTTCEIRFQPTSGPFQRVLVAAASTEHTITVAPGIHLTGTLSDGEGNTAATFRRIETYNSPDGVDRTYLTGQDSADDENFDIEVIPGPHFIEASAANLGRFESVSVDTPLVDYEADTVVNVQPVLQTMTINPVSPAGDPVSADVELQCYGHPQGQTAVSSQSTIDKASGTHIVVAGTEDDANGYCNLVVTPTFGAAYSLLNFDFVAGASYDVVVDPGITVSGHVSLDGVMNIAADSLRVRVSGAGGARADAFVQPDGTFTVEHAPRGDVQVQLYGEPGSGWEFALVIKPKHYDSDVTGLELTTVVDPLKVYLLDATGNPASATVKITCNGRPLGTPVFEAQSVTVTRSGTGLVTLPGYAVEPGEGSCVLKTTFASGLVMSRVVTIAPGGSTITQIESGSVTLDGDPTASNDLDDVPDSLEAYAPNVGDGDADGTPDYEQEDVASLPENGGGLGSGEGYVTVEGPDGFPLDDVVTDDVVPVPRPGHGVGGPPDGSVLPQGFLDFTVTGVPAGSVQTVTIHVPSTAGMNGYAVYDPVSDTWTDMPAADVSFTPTTIVLTVQDGGPLDRDPVAGRIRHPGGGTKLDVDVPVVSGHASTEPNDKGWYSGNVTVEWSVSDDQDDIDPPADTVVSTEGDDVTALAATESCDRRGNCVTGKLEHLKIDKTKPVVSLTGPVNGATYVLGGVPARQCTGTDPGGSGVPDGGACVVTVSGSTTSVGLVTVTAKATDRAGNSATKVVTYKQVYKAVGLVAPSAGKKVKVFEKGSTVVVQLKLVNAAGAAVTPLRAPVWVTPKASGKSKGKVNQPVSDVKPDKGTVLVRRGNVWEFRWGTAKAKKGKAYVITVQLDDGTTRSVTVGIG